MQATDMNSFMRKTIERSLKQVPALPDAVMRVLIETEKSEPSAAKVESIVTTDQAIVARLLKVVNSAYYGLPGQVVTVGQSLTILGLQQVRNLVLGLAAFGAFPTDSPRQAAAVRTCWLHGLATAGAAGQIGKFSGLSPKDQDLAFIGGLMHDLGRLFLMTQLTQPYEEAVQRAIKMETSLEEIEERMFGLGHAEIGRMLVVKWNFPQPLCNLIGLHEGPFDESTDASILCVHVGDSLTKDLYANPEVYRRLPDPVAISRLNLSDEKTAEIAQQAKIRTAEALEQLGSAA